LPGRCEALRFCLRFRATVFVGLIQFQSQPTHSAADRANIFFRCELLQARFLRHLDVDRETVGIFSGFNDQRIIGFRNGLQMNVAAEVMFIAQFARDAHHLLHRIVGAADDAGGEKQSFDEVTPVEVKRQLDHFIDSETGTRYIAGSAVDAIEAIVIAGVG
jgi:hypothetical protein